MYAFDNFSEVINLDINRKKYSFGKIVSLTKTTQ
ncbi:MAG: hypothetical protein ACI9V1_003187 [Spirosomataceae bacterium]|jgi:hypothetical protein